MACINSICSELDSLTVGNSFNCAPEKCTEYVNTTNTSINILHLNIRSLNKNFDQLQVLMHSTKLDLDVVILTECWLSKVSNMPVLDGYDSYFTGTNSNQNDGIVIFTKQALRTSEWEPQFVGGNCLVCHVVNQNIAIVAVYRSPSYSSKESTESFLDSLSSVYASLPSYKNIVLIGDINIDLKPNSKDDRCFNYLILNASHGLLPTHRCNTRLDNCLDHVLVKTTLPVTTLVLDSHITDHKPVLLNIANTNPDNKPLHIATRVDYNAVKIDLENSDFTPLYKITDPNISMNMFISIISSVIGKHTKQIKIPRKKRIIKPWITPGLLKCIQNRDRLHNRSRKDPNNLILKITYTRYRNFCNDLLRKLKIAHEKRELEKSRNHPKALWKTIKQITNTTKKKTSPVELLEICDNATSSVNEVSKFFSNIGTNLAEKIFSQSHQPTNPPRSSCQNISSSPTNSLVILEVDESEVESLILQLRNDCAIGWDGISPIVLKSCRQTLTPPLTCILNSCLKKGIFPDALKKAIIHPIHKGGNRNCVNNYRPISVLSALSKILERILSNGLNKFLNKHQLIADNQFGFRTGISTEDAVLGLTQLVAGNLDSGVKSLGIFLDLSKAFDTVSVPKLISKLEFLGVRGNTLEIFKDYLNNRTQRVKIGEHISEEVSTTYGVPQGSILGPTLFIIYVNELCRMTIPNSKIFAYADDTAIIVHGPTWDSVKSYAEAAMTTVMEWLNLNLLTLNCDKTSYIPFAIRRNNLPDKSFCITAHTCSKQSPQCLCPMLVRTDNVKYLGVQIDGGLRWDKQIDAVTTRCLKLLHIFKSLRDSAAPDTLKMVYYALCQSVIGFCITVWGGANKTSLLRIERAQRAVLKVMSRRPYRYPTAQLYADSKVLSVRQLFVLQSTVRKHASVPPTDPKKRRKLPLSAPHKTTFAQHQYYTLSTHIYKQVHKNLDIVDLNKYEVRSKLTEWLLEQDYLQTESLLKYVS